MFKRFRAWYQERTVRRVFLIAGGAGIFMLAVSPIDQTGYLLYGALLVMGIALGASISDTWQDYHKFKVQLRNVELTHKIRESEIFGGNITRCFEKADIKEIKKKKMQFRMLIGFKVLMIVILVAFLLNDIVS